MDFVSCLKERVLILDGGLGTMIQKYGFNESDYRGREFMLHSQPLAGFNDVLNITKPSAISKIHNSYLEAGADIITTNTFNSNTISLSDYGLDKVSGLVRSLNREGVAIAKKAISEFEAKKGGRHFIAGSIGPTNRSASMSPDISKPEKRNVTYDKLYKGYKEQIEGLIEGGADILLFETFFDTLNLKAGLAAANEVMKEECRELPIMVSATISDKSGHLLSGQTIGAFVCAIDNFENIVSIGINCGFGPEDVYDFLKELSKNSSHYISCHPNAGLPDESGCYKVTPQNFKEKISSLLNTGLLNIVGGCCGTTPEHIAEIKNLIIGHTPYSPKNHTTEFRLSGNEIFEIDSDNPFIIVGERCNVAGSRKFLRLIKENKIEEAAEIAENEIIEGAKIIDINMDDPLLDAPHEMVRFIRYISAEPNIAKVPFMIDSSRWEVIEDALKNIQGKGIVNSLSLKEGEEIFIERAKRVKELGFALIVMAFDEKGQADTFERKIEICQRAYYILTKKCGYYPKDIIFDVNIMAIATGMPEHSKYALEFIRAVKWIKENLPGTRTSGGVSNLSFSFRGKNKIREYMHSVFLHHAIEHGMDMAILNPATRVNYNDIPKEIKDLIEDLILTGNAESESKLISLVLTEETIPKSSSEILDRNAIRVNDRLIEDMVTGNLKYLHLDLDQALQEFNNPLEIIQGPLMEGMKKVGDLFGEGKMYLPQVVKTARVMNTAVEYLKPFMPSKKDNEGNSKSQGKILIATVKGDVHDIGKNIVSTVLMCNNYEVVDLGVMVPTEEIIYKIKEIKPDILCLSGLITPSLSEMAHVVEEMEKEGINIPIMVGGAATSPLHTVLKIAPLYSGIVAHMADASKNPVAAQRLLDENLREGYIAELNEKNNKLRKSFIANQVKLVPFKVAKEKGSLNKKGYKPFAPKIVINKPLIISTSLKDILPFINWRMFLKAWNIQGDYVLDLPISFDIMSFENLKHIFKSQDNKRKEAFELLNTAKNLISEIISTGVFDGKCVIRIDSAESEIDSIKCNGKVFPMLRQQREDSQFLACSDYINSSSVNDFIGFFALTAGHCWNSLSEKYLNKGDKYSSLILQTLADRIAEATAEWLHYKVRTEYWGYSKENEDISRMMKGNYSGIRPAWGYPMLPDQSMIFETQDLLPYQEIGITITENGAMYPSASISGLYISNPAARYFMVGEIGEDQIKSYSKLRGLSEKRVKEILRQS